MLHRAGSDAAEWLVADEWFLAMPLIDNVISSFGGVLSRVACGLAVSGSALTTRCQLPSDWEAGVRSGGTTP